MINGIEVEIPYSWSLISTVLYKGMVFLQIWWIFCFFVIFGVLLKIWYNLCKKSSSSYSLVFHSLYDLLVMLLLLIVETLMILRARASCSNSAKWIHSESDVPHEVLNESEHSPKYLVALQIFCFSWSRYLRQYLWWSLDIFISSQQETQRRHEEPRRSSSGIS